MASNTIISIVNILTKGAGRAKADLKGVADGTQKVADANVGANKASTDFYHTQAKGVVGTANSTKSFSKLQQTMGSGSGGVVGAYATLAANVFAVTAAFNALRSAAQMEQVEQGLSVMGARMGFNLKEASRAVQEISQYTLTAEQSMRSTAQVTSAGLGTKALKDLAQVARDTSVALGRNMEDSMDRLTRGVVKLEPELLDELGLMTKLGEATASYADKVGKSESQLSNFERRQAFLNAITAEGTAKFGGISQEIDNSAMAYEKLAASFRDLSKTTLGLIAGALNPLVSVLNSSPMALLGVAVLFGSTIRKQLLPGLTDLSAKTAEMAKELSEVTKQEIEDIIKFNPDSNPASLTTLQKKINAGTSGLNDYKRALEQVNIEIKNQEELVADSLRREKTGAPTVAQSLQHNVEVQSLKDLVEVRKELNEVIFASTRADARMNAANAISEAGNLNGKKSIDALKAAVIGYAEEQMLATGATTTSQRSMVALRTAAFGASIGVKALGAAFLNLLPVIGQAILAAGLLYEGYKWLINKALGKEVLEFNEALKAQEEIAKGVAEQMEHINNLRKSGTTIAAKEKQQYEILSNTLTEQVDAYNKSRDALTKIEGARATFRKGQFGLFENSPEQAMIEGLKELPEVYAQVQKELKKQGQEGILNKNSFSFMSDKERKAFDQAIKSLDPSFMSLGRRIVELSEASTGAGKAIRDFNKSAIPSTPYDAVVTSLESYTDSLLGVGQAAIAAGNFTERMANSLASAPTELLKFTSRDTQELVKEYAELERKTSEILRNGGKVADADKARLATLQDTLAVRTSEVFKVQEMFVHAQNQARITQSIVQLEQARLTKLNSYTALSGQDIVRRRNAENNIIQLQIKQLESQREIIENQLTMQRLTIDRNKALLEQDKIYQQLTASAQGLSTLTVNSAIAEISRNVVALENQTGPDLFGRREKQLRDYRETLGKLETIRDSAAQTSALEAQSAALRNQIEAQRLGITSRAVINAEAAAQNSATEAQNAEQLRQISEKRVQLDNTRQNIAIREAGRVNTMLDDYSQLLRTQRASAEAAKQAAALQTNSNIANLRLEQARARENGGTETVRILEARVASEKELLGLTLEQIDADNRFAIIEKFGLDTQKEGLTIQQQSIANLQKMLEVEKELVGAQREGRALEREISSKSSARAQSEAERRVASIEEARDEYEFAVRGVDLQKTVVELEYALLDAQREQLLFELKVRQQIVGANTDMGRQMQATITNLERSADYIVRARSAALDKIDQDVENARLRYQSAGLRDSTRQSGAAALEANARLRRAEARAAREAAQPDPFTPEEKPETYFAPLVKSQDILVTALNDNTAENKRLIEWAATYVPQIITTVTGSAKDAVVEAGKMIQGRGLNVWEHPEFGGVKGRHRGRGHAEGRAIDVYSKPGTGEWTDPAEKAKYDKLATELRAMGATVLWGVEGHFDHMHVEFKEGFTRQVEATRAIEAAVKDIPTASSGPAIEAAVREAPTATSSGPAIEVLNPLPTVELLNSIVPENLSEVVVTAQRDIQNLNSFIEDFNTLSTTGASSIEKVFQGMADSIGPGGDLVPNIITGINSIGSAYQDLNDVLASDDASLAERIEAYADVAMSVTNTLSSVLNSASEARIAQIDKEIAAEQARDGKSAESLAKIASLEKRKDAEARKSFNTNKKLMMAQAVISTAAAVAGALAAPPVPGSPWNIAMAAMMGGLGAAQLAIIAGTSYSGGASSASNVTSATPTLSIGKRGESVDLARNNANAGGEIGYLRGAKGIGRNASDYNVIGSAYGGDLPRGYGNTAFAVGEHGPEIITPETPITVRPMSDSPAAAPISAEFTIHALDARGVEDILYGQRGNIIGMIREAANANGQSFLEDVNVNVYTKPNVGRL